MEREAGRPLPHQDRPHERVRTGHEGQAGTLRDHQGARSIDTGGIGDGVKRVAEPVAGTRRPGPELARAFGKTRGNGAGPRPRRSALLQQCRREPEAGTQKMWRARPALVQVTPTSPAGWHAYFMVDDARSAVSSL